jgi:hypothetical protein
MSQSQVTPAQSAVVPVVAMIGDRPAVELQETIFTIGQETLDAEALMAKGEQARAVLDSNLHDIVKGLPYQQYTLVADFFKSGVVDAGKSSDAAQKVWERSINRLRSTFDFKPPKAESKDAERMAKKRQEAIDKLAKFGDDELAEQKAELLAKGDNKSLREVASINKEVERRNKGELDEEKAKRKMMVDTIIQRTRELGKAGTADADALLVAALLALG